MQKSAKELSRIASVVVAMLIAVTLKVEWLIVVAIVEK